MKKLFTLLLAIALIAPARATTLRVNSRSFTSEPTQKRKVTVTLTTAGPVVQSPWLIAGDSVAKTTDNNGICYFSNMLAGIYRLDIAGSPGRSFPFSMFDTNEVLDAAGLINSTNYNNHFYTSSQVDALIAQSIVGGSITNLSNGNGLPGVITGGTTIGTNLSSLATAAALTAATNGTGTIKAGSFNLGANQIDSWNDVTNYFTQGGSGDAQTPILQDVDVAGYSFSNMRNLSVTNAATVRTANVTNWNYYGTIGSGAFLAVSNNVVVLTNSSGGSGTGSSNMTDIAYAVWVRNSMIWSNDTGGQFSIGKTNVVGPTNQVEGYYGGTRFWGITTNGYYLGNGSLLTGITSGSGTGSSNATDVGYSLVIRSNMVFTNSGLSQMTLGATNASGATNQVEGWYQGTRYWGITTNGFLFGDGSLLANISAGASVSDTAYASSWNGVTTVTASKNAVYDWAHTFDTDDDGLPDKIDLSSAGFVRTTSGGVISSAELSGEVSTSGSAAVTIADGVAVSGWVLTSPTITSSINPTSNDGAAIGDATHQFSNLFLSESAAINWDNGDAVLTQSGDTLKLTSATLISSNTAFATNLVQHFHAGTVGFTLDDQFSIGSTGGTNGYGRPKHLYVAEDIYGGTFNGSGVGLTTLNGSSISSGTVDPARLGSGSSITTKFLRGDSTWQTVSASDSFWFTNAVAASSVSNAFNVKIAGNLDVTGTMNLATMNVTNFNLYSAIAPAVNDGVALGDTTHQFSDLYLAEGGVINWDNGDLLLTQSGDTLKVTSGTLISSNNAFATNLVQQFWGGTVGMTLDDQFSIGSAGGASGFGRPKNLYVAEYIYGGTFNGNGVELTNIPISSLTRSTNSMSATNSIDATYPYAYTNQTADITITNILNYTTGSSVVILNRMYVNSGGTHTISVPASWLDISSVGTIYNTNRGRLGIEIWPGVATNYVWSGN